MNTFIDNRTRNLIIAVLAVLAFFLLIQSAAAIHGIKRGNGIMPSNVITVRGTGEAVGVPDVATFSFTVREKGREVTAVQQAMSERAQKAIDYLKQQGVEEKDIKTESYYTNPTYEYTRTLQILTGYEASETFRVKVRDFNKAGTLLSGVAGLEIGEVSSSSFEIDDPEALKAEAKEQAIEKAREDAKRTARALGVRLGKVVNFYEDYPYTPYAGYGGDAAMSGVKSEQVVVPPLQPGETKITTSVSVTYELLRW